MAGFFGLEWTHNVTLEPIIEMNGFNNSLAGYYQCNNSNSYQSTGGNNASLIWENIYLADATKRLKALAGGYNWTVADTYNAQTMCPYEEVAFVGFPDGLMLADSTMLTDLVPVGLLSMVRALHI